MTVPPHSKPIPKAAILAAALALGGCASSRQSFIYSPASSLVRLEDHHSLAADPSPEHFRQLGDRWVLDGHAVEGGHGWVLQADRAGHLLWAIDSAWFEYLTIYLPEPNLESGSARFPEEALAFFSSGTVAFPSRSGCAGYASGGTIEYRLASNGLVRAKVHLKLNLKSPRGRQKDCGDRTIDRAFRFKRREVRKPESGDPG